MNRYQAIVSAIVYALIPRHQGEAQIPTSERANSVAQFVLDQHARMPDFLRLPIRTLTFVFDWLALLTYGRRFHRLPEERRILRLAQWRMSPFGPLRDFVKFYETLTLFGGYAQLHEGAVCLPESAEG